ncbi:MAG TPA: hypothetical protein DCG53_07495 [Syntrophus sp. (in: bacteria)]|jgi:hypothetical protein|nr:hypothetical protein [Syntrophus sp. (in: bacteria)]
MKPVYELILRGAVAILIVVSFVGCGAPNVYKAKEGARKIDSLTVNDNFKEIYYLAVLSNCASHPQVVTHVQSDTKAIMWFGRREDVYAVIEFIPINDKKSQITFYDYAGVWMDCWVEIKQAILSKGKGI